MSRPRWSGFLRRLQKMLKLLECVSYSVLGISSSSLLFPNYRENHISKPFHASLDHFYAKMKIPAAQRAG
ncbi:hypothetical protein NC653_000643 [Populus alba x Populus x berolinensis]|uniref:Uncharacterized protein n=1 Tax=Populus alba x Populus x berolinensis TaxID=444605 RepID=A0AAD6RJ42_9ROSI|nr:hypothetical protein NC653_000643 [Populus alba x Populus x berolinensis]